MQKEPATRYKEALLTEVFIDLQKLLDKAEKLQETLPKTVIETTNQLGEVISQSASKLNESNININRSIKQLSTNTVQEIKQSTDGIYKTAFYVEKLRNQFALLLFFSGLLGGMISGGIAIGMEHAMFNNTAKTLMPEPIPTTPSKKPH